jgi:hypothetical protein
MDFSSFNAAEQAHMSKVIEKRQVWTLHPDYSSLCNECETDARFPQDVRASC